MPARSAAWNRQRIAGYRNRRSSAHATGPSPHDFEAARPRSAIIGAYDALRLALAIAACIHGALSADVGLLAIVLVAHLGLAAALVPFRIIARQTQVAGPRPVDRVVFLIEKAIACLCGIILPALAVQTADGLQVLVGNALAGGLVAVTFLAPSRSSTSRAWKFAAFASGLAVPAAQALHSPNLAMIAAEAAFGLTLAVSCAVLESILSEETAKLQQAQHEAEHDHLTGLLNRKGLERVFDRLSIAAKVSGKTRGDLCLLFIDLDGFKNVNDRYGHSNADQLLRCVAGRIEKCFRSGDPVARVGGDEFVVLMRHEDASEIVARSQQLLDSLLLPVFLERSVKIVVSASIGIAVSSGEDHNLVDLLHVADTALYEAKAAGKAVWRISSRVAPL